MKRAMAGLLLFGGLAMALPLPAHAGKPIVVWHIDPPAHALKPGVNLNVVLAAHIDPGWHLYALEEPPGTSSATLIGLVEGDPADLLHVDEGRPITSFDPLSNVPIRWFSGTANFILNLELAKDLRIGPTSLHVMVRYQSCNDRLCLPPHTDLITVPFTVEK